MKESIDEFSGVEPDTSKCCTEEIISDLYRCSNNNRKCEYGLPAGTTSTYCLHPEFKKFVSLSPVGVKTAAFRSPGKQSS